MSSKHLRFGLVLTAVAMFGFAPPSHASDTALLFRTQVGAVSIPQGQSKTLGVVDIHDCRQIRVVADERIGSPSNVVIRLTIMEGNELVAFLDSFVLAPHSQLTRVYDVPGTKLMISAEAQGVGAGSDAVDVLLYGN